MDPAAGVGVLAALAAGAVSFLSPCVLPLVPGYLSAVIGVRPAELHDVGIRRVLVPSLWFVATFSLIFILLGLGATALGSLLRENREWLEKGAAVIIVLLGLMFVASPFVRALNHEWHVNALLERASGGSPVLAGAAFAIAWTPCVGPTLGAILTAAALSESTAHAALLLVFYCAGLAIPFLATALAFDRMTGVWAVVRRHSQLVLAFGGIVLVGMGVLVWTGELFQLNIEAQRLLDRLGLNFFQEI